MNLFQKGIAQIKISHKVSFLLPIKRLAYDGVTLVSMAVPTSWRKCLSVNKTVVLQASFK